VVNPHALIGSGGGQRTARPTRRYPKVKFNCHNPNSEATVSFMDGQFHGSEGGGSRTALLHSQLNSRIGFDVNPNPGPARCGKWKGQRAAAVPA